VYAQRIEDGKPLEDFSVPVEFLERISGCVCREWLGWRKGGREMGERETEREGKP
jgi:hypothetical protein